MPELSPLEALLARTAAAWGVTVADLRGRARPKLLGPARQAFVLAAVRGSANSYRVIGDVMGRDHSTVMTAQDVGSARANRDPEYAARVQALIDGAA